MLNERIAPRKTNNTNEQKNVVSFDDLENLGVVTWKQ